MLLLEHVIFLLLMIFRRVPSSSKSFIMMKSTFLTTLRVSFITNSHYLGGDMDLANQDEKCGEKSHASMREGGEERRIRTIWIGRRSGVRIRRRSVTIGGLSSFATGSFASLGNAFLMSTRIDCRRRGGGDVWRMLLLLLQRRKPVSSSSSTTSHNHLLPPLHILLIA
jgi:hypothetical protein